jgi:peptidoglycan/xylan/chitin deacetylase (PgdA/CDA1 family)
VKRLSIKDIVKNIFFFLYVNGGYPALRDFLQSRRGRASALVLCYHRIGARDVLTKPAEDFRREMQTIKRHYECISLGELCRRLLADEPFRRPAVVVTFDDGYRDNFTAAVPILQSIGVPATFFVATGFMSTDRVFPHDGPQSDYPKLTWDDLRAMQTDGFEIGSHTVNHLDLGAADDATTLAEVRDSLTTLNRELGTRPRAFAFPWGKPQNISGFAIEAIQEAGYYAAVSAYGGINTRGASPFHIRRVDAGNGHLSQMAVRARIAGFDADFIRLKMKTRRREMSARGKQ